MEEVIKSLKIIPLKIYLLFIIIIAVGLTISLTAYFVGNNQENDEIQTLSFDKANETANLIQIQFNNLITSLEAIALYFRLNNGNVTTSQFDDYARLAKEQFSGLGLIQFVEIIPNKSLNTYNRRQAKFYGSNWPSTGVFQFPNAFTDRSTNFSVYRNRTTYYPVTYIYPFSSNQQVLGFDSGTENGPQIQKSLELHVPVSSYRLVLISSQNIGFLILTPIFKLNGLPLGFVVGVSSVQGIITQLLQSIDSSTINFALFEKNTRVSGEAFLYCSNDCDQNKTVVPSDFTAYAGFRYQLNITIATSVWIFVAVPTSQLVSSQRTFFPQAFLIVILCIMGCLLLFLCYNIYQYQKTLRLAGKL